jgi:uncharacterized membrane protein YqhA
MKKTGVNHCPHIVSVLSITFFSLILQAKFLQSKEKPETKNAYTRA